MSFWVNLSIEGDCFVVILEVVFLWGVIGVYIWFVEDGKVKCVDVSVY